MDDEFLDYWEPDYEDLGDDFTVSLYALPLVAAALISLVLVILVVYGINRSRNDAALPAALVPPIEDALPADRGEQGGGTGGGIAALFTPSVQYWADDIVGWASEWGIDPNLAATVMQIESCGHPDVVSSAGATGLFQVMPFHFKAGESATDPNTNAYRGMAYLSRSMEAHAHNVLLALAGYNAGIAGSRRPQSAWPAETQRYTYWGSGIYEDAVNSHSSSARLDEWLAAGGAGLCSRAAARLGISP